MSEGALVLLDRLLAEVTSLRKEVQELKEIPAAAPNVEDESMDVHAVMEYLGVGKYAAYELFRRNDFPAIRIGKQLRTTRKLLDKWLEEQSKNEKTYLRVVNR
ncbi:hypothetical protein EAL2_c10850 [Peptoclostridium acidaminophilum DSM 3953]|uniref:Helix-turn-helix domain-containing protein n=1 Tax=Peptoclostridium acidaminophilum DSM 3953 TaxID=1286171 RepID=W8TEX5_PEPAC|nr:helix-turn-helix domain-containing protein [Peptoclostridium acidaminophilum]AHM56383.1 hypothetical protein EAL2_c10850 [Peptoclostridium acidaminophilum DSM 3953]